MLVPLKRKYLVAQVPVQEPVGAISRVGNSTSSVLFLTSKNRCGCRVRQYRA